MEDTVNKYLDYVVTEWMEENKLAVESGIKTEITESFITGLKTLFENNYVEVPEGKEDLLATADKKASDLEAKLHESIETIAALKAQVEGHDRKDILESHSDDLTDTQKEKLASLVEGIEFVDAEAFGKKVKTIRESFFTGDKASAESDDKGDLNEETDKGKSGQVSKMDRYLSALSA
jgi:hypothetical protein